VLVRTRAVVPATGDGIAVVRDTRCRAQPRQHVAAMGKGESFEADSDPRRSAIRKTRECGQLGRRYFLPGVGLGSTKVSPHFGPSIATIGPAIHSR
jgi:hypothetical protein